MGRIYGVRKLSTIAAMAVALVTSGCIADPPNAEELQLPSVAASPTPTPSSVPISTAKPSVARSCLEIVDPAVIEQMISGGLEADSLWPDQTELYGALHQRFAEFGGVSCRWGKPQSDNVRIYSYTPTTPQQSALLESELTTAGYTSETRERGTVYSALVEPGTFFLVTGDEVFETHGVESFDDLLPYAQ